MSNEKIELEDFESSILMTSGCQEEKNTSPAAYTTLTDRRFIYRKQTTVYVASKLIEYDPPNMLKHVATAGQADLTRKVVIGLISSKLI
jgi:hypothetical protein